MSSISLPERLSVPKEQRAAQKPASIQPLDLWWATISATLIPVSLIWDFSWESSIGVDRFWSPPHLATHIGVWLSGLLGIRLLTVFTVARRRGLKAFGVNLGPLCGPSGAWALVWGAVLMLAAFLLDNWWQKTYGLGAGLWHPPQILKAVGFIAILVGGILLCPAARATNPEKEKWVRYLSCWHGGLLLTMAALVLTMTNYTNKQHTAFFYLISCSIYPAILIGIGRTGPARWGSTGTA